MSAKAGGYIERRRSNLRGRRPVRADRRLRADEKRIRAQSAILYRTPRTAFAFIQNRVFRTDVLFIRPENTVGARERAMTERGCRRRQEGTSSGGDRTCADGGPSARIVDCARMKNASVRNRRSCIKTPKTGHITCYRTGQVIYYRQAKATGGDKMTPPSLYWAH